MWTNYAMQWTEEEKVKHAETKSELNWSDSLSKANGRIKHHQHMDCTMGRRQPKYSRDKLRELDAAPCSTYRITKALTKYDVMSAKDFCDSASAGE